MKSLESIIEEYQSLNLGEVLDHDKFSTYALTAHSTRIEGSTLTEEETSLLIDEGITPKGKPLEHSLMVTDHYKALLKVIDLAKSVSPISSNLVMEINALVMASTGKIYRTALGDVDASKGELRKGQVYVAKRYFPSYDKVPKLLEEYCTMINEEIETVTGKIEKLKLSYRAHFNLVSIHPHYDGNGRTSRLMMNLLQYRFGLPMGIVHSEDKLEYFSALEKSRSSESLDAFNAFTDAQYIKQLSSEIDMYKTQVLKKGKGFDFNML